MKYNTIIFDLDGTLLNTLEDLMESTNFALNKHSFPSRTIDEIRNFVGNGVEKLIERAVPYQTSDTKTALCLQDFRMHYSDNNKNKTRPYDGIMELLQNLKLNGAKLAVVSNKYDSAVKVLCKDYFHELIQVAIGESPMVAKKPAPDSVYEAIKKLDSRKEDTIYVGDSDVDILTAHNAGLKCISVTWGFRSRDILVSYGADHIIDEPKELLDYLLGPSH